MTPTDLLSIFTVSGATALTLSVLYFLWQRRQAAANRLLLEKLNALESRQAADLDLVSSIARQVNSLENPRAIFQQVGDFAHKQLGLHLVMIYRIDPETGSAEMMYSSHPDYPAGLTVDAFTAGLIGSALRDRTTLVVDNVADDKRYIPGIGAEGKGNNRNDKIAQRTTAEVVIPLIVKDEVIGVMDLQNDHAEGFSERNVRVLDALAQEVAGAIDRARALAAQREQAWSTRMQLEVARSIAELPDFDLMLEAVTRLTQMASGARQCAILIRDWQSSLFMPVAYAGASGDAKAQFLERPIALGEWGSMDAVAVGLEARQTNEPAAWFRLVGDGPLELHPLLAGGNLHGIALIEASHDSSVTAQQETVKQEMLAGILRQIARQIERRNMREALQTQAWTNVALLQVAQSMNSLINLDDILETVVQLVGMLVGVEFCFLMVADEVEESLTPGPTFGLSAEAKALLANWDALELDEQMAISQMPLDTGNGIALHDFTLPSPLIDAIGQETVKVVPLRARNTIVGLLAIGNPLDGQGLHGRRFNLLAGIAQQAAIAVVNNQLNAESAETERLQQELNVALSIQASLIPDGSPDIPGLRLASYWEAAREVSGDFYDFMQFADGRWGIVIADVAGKGVPAALFMALSRTILRSVSFARSDPADTLIRTNEIILNDTHADRFVTIFLAIWYPKSGVLHFANGGHNRPLLLKADGTVSEVGDYGIALGVIDTLPLVPQSLHVDVGDTVILYTDGVNEAMNHNQETLGIEAVKTLLSASPPETPQDTIAAIRSAIVQHSAGEPQSDDVTMVVLKRTE